MSPRANGADSLISSPSRRTTRTIKGDPTFEAAVLQQATSQAIVVARSVLNAGGSHQTALSTAKAAAQSTIVPYMTSREKGTSRLFLGRRKAKRQADIIASMALLSVTNGAPEGSLGSPEFFGQGPTSPSEVDDTKSSLTSLSISIPKKKSKYGSQKSDLTGISESVQELTNRAPTTASKSEPKHLTAKAYGQDPIYASPRGKNRIKTMSLVISDEDSQSDDFDTLETLSTDSLTYGSTLDGRGYDKGGLSAWLVNFVSCGMGESCAHEGEKEPDFRKMLDQRDDDDDATPRADPTREMRDSSSDDTQDMLQKLNGNSSREQEMDPSKVGKHRSTATRDSMEQVVLRAISTIPSAVSDTEDMSDDPRVRTTQLTRRRYTAGLPPLGKEHSQALQLHGSKPDLRVALSDPSPYDNNSVTYQDLSPVSRHSTKSSSTRTRFRRWVTKQTGHRK